MKQYFLYGVQVNFTGSWLPLQNCRVQWNRKQFNFLYVVQVNFSYSWLLFQNGRVQCNRRTDLCSPRPCSHPETLPGDCCPVCDGCLFMRRRFANGQKFVPAGGDPCKICRCMVWSISSLIEGCMFIIMLIDINRAFCLNFSENWFLIFLMRLQCHQVWL